MVLMGLTACGGTPSPIAPDTGAAEAPSSTEPAAPNEPGAQCLAAANATPAPVADAPRKIEVSHVLVRHAASEGSSETPARSREEACLRALDALKALRGGDDFEAVVERFSDERGAASRGGVLGEISAEDVAPAFAAAAFALEINAVSYVVETPFGFHVILRTR